MAIDLGNQVLLSHLHDFKSLSHLIRDFDLLDISNQIRHKDKSELDEFIAKRGYLDSISDNGLEMLDHCELVTCHPSRIKQFNLLKE